MIRRPVKKTAALTLVEMSVAIGIMAIMFGALGYLVVMTARNSALVSEQALSQNHAAAAAERITNTVRNAALIYPYGTDDKTTTLTRILYDIPDLTKSSGFRTGAIAFVPPTTGESDGVVKIFTNSSDYKPGSVKTDKADYTYSGIQKFGINYRTSTWMTVSVFYAYRSYMNYAAHNNVFASKLAGEFITDAIAKNHHPGEDAHYAETTTSLFLL